MGKQKMRTLLSLLSIALATASPRIPEHMYAAAQIIKSGSGPAPNIPCVLGHCSLAIAKCAANSDCRKALSCTKGCGKGGAPSNQTCIFQCTSDFENDVYDAMLKCFFTDHDCMRLPKGQTYNKWEMCRATDRSTPLSSWKGKPYTQDMAKTHLTRAGKDGGYWLVAEGLSHAYDCFDCQNLWFNKSAVNDTQLHYSAIYKIHKSDHTFRWNVANYECDW